MPDCYYTRFRPRHGKTGYWRIIDRVFEDAKFRRWEYFFMFPDDVTLEPDLFSSVIELVSEVDPDTFGCISFNTDNRTNAPQWTGVEPVEMGNLICTQWVDMLFVAKRNMLQALEYRMLKPNRRFVRYVSSGVGAAISKKLHRRGLKMYHAKRVLAHSDDHPSMMHPEFRERNPNIY